MSSKDSQSVRQCGEKNRRVLACFLWKFRPPPLDLGKDPSGLCPPVPPCKVPHEPQKYIGTHGAFTVKYLGKLASYSVVLAQNRPERLHVAISAGLGSDDSFSYVYAVSVCLKDLV